MHSWLHFHLYWTFDCTIEWDCNIECTLDCTFLFINHNCILDHTTLLTLLHHYHTAQLTASLIAPFTLTASLTVLLTYCILAAPLVADCTFHSLVFIQSYTIKCNLDSNVLLEADIVTIGATDQMHWSQKSNVNSFDFVYITVNRKDKPSVSHTIWDTKSLRGMGCQGRRGMPMHLAAHNTNNHPKMPILFLNAGNVESWSKIKLQNYKQRPNQ